MKLGKLPRQVSDDTIPVIPSKQFVNKSLDGDDVLTLEEMNLNEEGIEYTDFSLSNLIENGATDLLKANPYKQKSMLHVSDEIEHEINKFKS